MVITEFLDLSAMLVPERTAIAFEGRRFSYAQLKERVNRLVGYKRPSSVTFVKEELSKTSTGKVLRRVLREKYGLG
jgi:acyl-CoA synthetase (AMP-forming)/AMP-acid ligase II